MKSRYRRQKPVRTDELPSLFEPQELDALSMGVTPPPAEMPEPLAATLEAMREDAVVRRDTDRLLVLSFGSGSSGNCYYIGSRQEGVLIDAGVDDKAVLAALEAHAIPRQAIQGLFVTHDHGDHVRYLYSMMRRLKDVKFYCTPRILKGMLERHNLSRRLRDYHVAIYKEFETRIGNYMGLTAFEVSHDGIENVGYYITFGPWHTLALVTDTGYVTERADYYMRRSRHIILESNYDEHMLDIGPYPEYLKDRIRSRHGHLSNLMAADYVAGLTPPPEHLLLCHLSQDNNTPDTAYATMRDTLQEAGRHVIGYDDAPSAVTNVVRVAPLPRTQPSPLYVFVRP